MIKYCIYYSAPKVCIKCDSNHLLSFHKTECVDLIENIVDPNCYEYEFKIIPICSGCSPGFYFEEDSCVRCPNTEGCLQCDPFNDLECLICAPNYYQ